MNILKKKVSLSTAVSAIALVALIGVGGLVHALTIQGTPQEVLELVNGGAPSQELGGTNSPYFNYDFQSLNSTRHEYRHSGMATATTSACSLASPSATSVLQFLSVDFSTGSTSAFRMYAGYAGSTNATTTALGTYMDVAGNTNATWSLATTSSPFYIIAPNQYINVSMQTQPGQSGGVGTYSPVGTCQAEFVVTSYQ